MRLQIVRAKCLQGLQGLQVCRTCRFAVSGDASLVFAGLYPVELLAIEARDIRNLITEGTMPHRARTLCRRNTIQLGNFAGVRQKKADGHITLHQTLSNALIESTGRSIFI